LTHAKIWNDDVIFDDDISILTFDFQIFFFFISYCKYQINVNKDILMHKRKLRN